MTEHNRRMKFNSALTFTLLYITGYFCQLDVCGRAPLNSKIVGGVSAKAGRWPWQVSIHIVDFGHHCGGTLITKDWVLSVAHCFRRSVSSYVLYFGRLHQFDSNPYETSRTARQIIIHPYYDDLSLVNDIALVQLSSSVNFTKYIRPVCLSSANSTFAEGTQSWVTGWGRVLPGGPFPDTLQQVVIPVVSDGYCRKSYGSFFTSNMICAGLLNQGGKSICRGDSGGPMLSRNGSLWIQSGISSFTGQKCDDANYPSVFVRVSRYLDWIMSYMGSNPPGIVAFNPKSSSDYGRVPHLLLFPLSLTLSIIPLTFHSHFLKLI